MTGPLIIKSTKALKKGRIIRPFCVSDPPLSGAGSDAGSGTGLGTRLIQRGLAPDSETELRYEAQGFSAVIRSPLDQIST